VDAQSDAVTAAKMREAGIRPVAAGAPETPGTRLRGLLAALGIGHGADGQPTAPRPTGPTMPTDVAQGPGGSDLGQHIGGFAGGTLAGALERQGAQPGAHGPMPSLPPTMQQPAPPPLQPQTMAPQGASLMVGAFNPATGTFNSGAQPLAPVQAVVDDPPPAVQPPAPPSRAQRQYEPLSRGYEIETEDSRTAREQALAEALYQQKAQHDAAERARRAGVYGGAVNDPALAGVLAEDAATGRTLISDRTDQTRNTETGRHNRADESLGWARVGLDRQQEARMAQQARSASGAQPAAGKALPASVTQALIENDNALSKIDEAIQLLGAHPDAVGLKNAVPGMVTYRNRRAAATGNTDDIRTRAIVGDVGSLKIHDRTGAAMSPKEWERLKAFIPTATDDHTTAITKLQQLRTEVAREHAGLQAAYGARAGTGASAPAAEPPRQATGRASVRAADLWEQYRQQGMTPEQATAAVQRQMGGPR
jgi:hypothetical protein